MSIANYNKTPGSNATVGDAPEAVGIQEGMPRTDVNDAMRAMCADMAKDYADQGGIVSTGISTALAVTTNAGITALRDGLRLTFKASVTVADNATLSVNGLAAESLVVARSTGLGSVLAAEFIAGALVSVVRDQGSWVILNPATLSEIVDNDDLTVSPSKAPTRANVDNAIAAAAVSLGISTGTWTPVVGTRPYNETDVAYSGVYTRIGDLVFCEFTLIINESDPVVNVILEEDGYQVLGITDGFPFGFKDGSYHQGTGATPVGTVWLYEQSGTDLRAYGHIILSQYSDGFGEAASIKFTSKYSGTPVFDNCTISGSFSYRANSAI